MILGVSASQPPPPPGFPVGCDLTDWVPSVWCSIVFVASWHLPRKDDRPRVCHLVPSLNESHARGSSSGAARLTCFQRTFRLSGVHRLLRTFGRGSRRSRTLRSVPVFRLSSSINHGQPSAPCAGRDGRCHAAALLCSAHLRGARFAEEVPVRVRDRGHEQTVSDDGVHWSLVRPRLCPVLGRPCRDHGCRG